MIMLTCGRCVTGASHGVMITHTAVSCLVEVPRYTTRQEHPLTQTLTLQDDTRRMHGSCRRQHECNSTDTRNVCSALRRTQGFPSPPNARVPGSPRRPRPVREHVVPKCSSDRQRLLRSNLEKGLHCRGRGALHACCAMSHSHHPSFVAWKACAWFLRASVHLHRKADTSSTTLLPTAAVRFSQTQCANVIDARKHACAAT